MEAYDGKEVNIIATEFKELLHSKSRAFVAFSGVRAIAFNPSNDILASGSDDGTVKLFSFPEGEELLSIKHTDRIWFITFSPRGSYLASGSEDGRAKIWDIKQGKLIIELRHNSGIWPIVFSPDEKLAAFGAYRAVHIFDIGRRKKVKSLSHKHWVNAVTFSGDGNFLAVGVEDGTIKIWRLKR